MYGAKGVNRNWDWLAMIAVCIYSLRDAMRTVQKTFQIPIYGTRHTTPEMIKEVHAIAGALQEERVQEYVSDRPANKEVDQRRDLIGEGSKYANKRSAFSKYHLDDSILHNLGFKGDPVTGNREDADEEEDGEEEEYIPTEEDLAMDDEEPIELANQLLENAIDFFS